MWTPTPREQYTRTAARYETDLTDAEWAMIEPHMPPRSKRGRPPSWTFREILDAIFYVLRGGIPWRLMPSDLPPWPTVYGRFAAWRDSGLFETINHALVMTDRVRVGREASPSARSSAANRARPPRTAARAATTLARVRLDGAHHQWRKVPSGELSIDPEADERLGRGTGPVEASGQTPPWAARRPNGPKRE